MENIVVDKYQFKHLAIYKTLKANPNAKEWPDRKWYK